MKFEFKKATKEQAKGRVFMAGPSGSGKTYTSLVLAETLKNGGEVAVIDTEHGSASKYSDIFDFCVLNLDSPTIENYIEAIHVAEENGFDVIVIDSLTHAWDAAKEDAEKIARQSKSGNRFTAWAKVTPKWKRLLATMIRSRCHVVATARSKQKYILEEEERNGYKKTTPKKVGLDSEVRDGVEYEFDIAADMDLDHCFMVTKTRCPSIDGEVVEKPNRRFFQVYKDWLQNGSKVERPLDDSAESPKDESANPQESSQASPEGGMSEAQKSRIWKKTLALGKGIGDLESYSAATFETDLSDLSADDAASLERALISGDFEKFFESKKNPKETKKNSTKSEKNSKEMKIDPKKSEKDLTTSEKDLKKSEKDLITSEKDLTKSEKDLKKSEKNPTEPEKNSGLTKEEKQRQLLEGAGADPDADLKM